jgi:hypothetical protein
MKKVILGLCLVLVIGAVAYLKTVRETERQAEAYAKGQDAGIKRAEDGQISLDSLAEQLAGERRALAEYKATVADSIARQEERHRVTVDSLSRVIDSQQSDIDRLQKQTLVSKTADTTGDSGDATRSNGTSHQDIVNHYRLAMSRLPADLSDYEYQVAVKEVRIETAARFQITVERLNQIRKEYNVNF